MSTGKLPALLANSAKLRNVHEPAEHPQGTGATGTESPSARVTLPRLARAADCLVARVGAAVFTKVLLGFR